MAAGGAHLGENSSVRATSKLPCILRWLADARCHAWRDVRCSPQALPDRAKSRRQLTNERRALWLPDCVRVRCESKFESCGGKRVMPAGWSWGTMRSECRVRILIERDTGIARARNDRRPRARCTTKRRRRTTNDDKRRRATSRIRHTIRPSSIVSEEPGRLLWRRE